VRKIQLSPKGIVIFTVNMTWRHFLNTSKSWKYRLLRLGQESILISCSSTSQATSGLRKVKPKRSKRPFTSWPRN
jgi:hypothetical protein